MLVTLIRYCTEPVVGRLLVRHGQRLTRRNPAVPVDYTVAEVSVRFEHVLHPLWKDGRVHPPPLGKAFDAPPPARERPSRRHAGARLVRGAHRRRWAGAGAMGWNPVDRREVASLSQVDWTEHRGWDTQRKSARYRVPHASSSGRSGSR